MEVEIKNDVEFDHQIVVREVCENCRNIKADGYKLVVKMIGDVQTEICLYHYHESRCVYSIYSNIDLVGYPYIIIRSLGSGKSYEDRNLDKEKRIDDAVSYIMSRIHSIV